MQYKFIFTANILTKNKQDLVHVGVFQVKSKRIPVHLKRL